jgi:hypothetical protein
MYDEKYQEAIDKIKEIYPQFKDVRFTLENGELGYISGAWTLINKININELQQFVNNFLGQKSYRAEYVGYVNVYARSEEEAKEFTNDIKPNVVSRIKIIQIDESSKIHLNEPSKIEKLKTIRRTVTDIIKNNENEVIAQKVNDLINENINDFSTLRMILDGIMSISHEEFIIPLKENLIKVLESKLGHKIH